MFCMRQAFATFKSSMCLGVLIAVALLPVEQAAAVDEGVSVTVYSSADPAGFDPQQFIAQQRVGFGATFAWQVPGFGVVKEVRTLDVAKGISSLEFTDVAQFIDPTTVSFVDLTDDRTRVLEQNFQFDLVSPEKLMERYLDQNITVHVQEGEDVSVVEGRLLASRDGSLIIRLEDGSLQVIPSDRAWVTLPGGTATDSLLTRPTLTWIVDSPTGGSHTVRTTYQTSGMTWRSDYNLVLSDDDSSGDLTAWVTLMNLSGATFDNARLKLVAGDVQRVQPSMNKLGAVRRGGIVEAMAEDGFSEQSFFEYHLYTLSRPTDLKLNSTQQLALFPPVSGIDVTKTLVFAPTVLANYQHGREPLTNASAAFQGKGKVQVLVSFANSKENRMGMPLPAGKVRAYKQDPADGTLEFIGEDMIDHTPRNESVQIKLGDSFDVVAERTVMDFKLDKSRKTMQETIRVQIRNQKAVAQSVLVRERLYRWKQWKITSIDGARYEKVDSNTIKFDLEVKPESSSTVTYTVEYTW